MINQSKGILYTDPVCCPYCNAEDRKLSIISTVSTLVGYLYVDNNCHMVDYRCHCCRNVFRYLYKIGDNAACYMDDNSRLIVGERVCDICMLPPVTDL